VRGLSVDRLEGSREEVMMLGRYELDQLLRPWKSLRESPQRKDKKTEGWSRQQLHLISLKPRNDNRQEGTGGPNLENQDAARCDAGKGQWCPEQKSTEKQRGERAELMELVYHARNRFMDEDRGRRLNLIQFLLSLRRATWLALLCALCISRLAEAQYTAPGSGLSGPQVVTKESLDRQLEQSRWTLGGLRITPYAGISDITYQTNVFGTETGQANDFTANLHAGLDFMLPLGPNGYFTALIRPGYNWWQELSDQRQFVGLYEANIYGLFNRMSLDLSAGRNEQVERFTSEILQRAPTIQENIGLNLNLDLAKRIQINASGHLLQTTLEEPTRPDELEPLQAPLLNREEKRARLGLSFHGGDRWSFGLGIQEEATDFDQIALDRSNEGSSVFATVTLSGNRLAVGLDVVERSLRSRHGSGFADFDNQTGHFRVALHPGWRFDYFIYGSRSLSYSLVGNNSFFEVERIGAGLGASLSSRTGIRFYVESGQNLFTALEGQVASDDEDFRAFGGDLNFSIRENMSYRIGGERIRFESKVSGLVRSETRLNSGLSISFSRSLGPSGVTARGSR
jgi:hypothetical protein